MDNATQQLDAGNLAGATEAALNFVKANPTDERARTLLFELSCFSGEWDRAEKQLDVIGHQDAKAAIGTVMYRQNFHAERNRMKLFSDGLKPEFIQSPPSYVDDLLSAVNRIREGNIAEARQIIDEVEENRPALPCTVNGEQYSDFRDYNDLTMCVFEVIHKDSYVWLPMEQVERITFFKPKSLRDLYWIQAEVELKNGIKGEMFFPALYSGSWQSENDQVRLGRMTDWRSVGEDIYLGEGTKLFWMDGKDKSVLDIETIDFSQSDKGA